MMKKKKIIEYLVVITAGLLFFALLNIMMVVAAPPQWTDTHFGAWTAFHRGFRFSGFDQFTYIIISMWRPLYTHLRHPLLAYMIWPLTEINEYLKDTYKINCAIYVLAAAWTMISTLSWVLMYKILRRIVEMTFMESLLLTLMLYSFAYVMLATFVPDHMILSMTVTLATLYLAGKAWKQNKSPNILWMLLLYFIGTGISTTNAAKLWLIDTAAVWRGRCLWTIFKRGLLYVIPTLLIAWLYFYEERTAVVEENKYQARIAAKAIAKDSVEYQKKKEKGEQRVAARTGKQLVDNPLFEWTDYTIPMVPSLVENIFGEGFQLHRDHLLGDANIAGGRPIIVKYDAWYNYLFEAMILLLLIAGIATGWRERFMWICLMPFLFDMVIHIGLRFALTDVYIMTAHWAYVIPVATAYLMRKVRQRRTVHKALLLTVSILTIYLLSWNLSLLYSHLFLT